eukprot:487589_1
MLEDSKKMTPHEDRYCLSDSQRNRKYSTRPKAEKCIYSLCALAFLTAKTLHLKNVYIQRTNFRCDPMESIQRSERTNCDGSSHYKDLMRWEIRTKLSHLYIGPRGCVRYCQIQKRCINNVQYKMTHGGEEGIDFQLIGNEMIREKSACGENQ